MNPLRAALGLVGPGKIGGPTAARVLRRGFAARADDIGARRDTLELVLVRRSASR